MPRKEKPCPLMWLAELRIGPEVDAPDDSGVAPGRVLSTTLMWRRAEREARVHRDACMAAGEVRLAKSRAYAALRKAGEPTRTAEFETAFADRCRAVGSRNWLDVLPIAIATHQLAFEREAYVVRALELGLTFKALAQRMGLGTNRVRQIRDKALRRRRNPDARSPIEKYFDERFDRESY